MPGNSPPRGDIIGLIVAVMLALLLFAVYGWVVGWLPPVDSNHDWRSQSAQSDL